MSQNITEPPPPKKGWPNYPLTVVPAWCQMSPSDHQDNIGGCWGISSGKVAENGVAHCKTCEFNGSEK